MKKVFQVGERYTTICGPERDDFLGDLLDLREGADDDITLDFTGVRQLNSIALAAIGKLHVWMEEHNHKLIVCGLNETLDKTFRITGLKRVMHVTDTTPEGLSTEPCLT